MVARMNQNSVIDARIIRLVLTLILSSSMLFAVPSAQLGEVAGQIHFHVPLGGSQTLQLSLLNEGNTSIGVQVNPPQNLQITSNAMLAVNQITPKVYIAPQNVTLPAHGEVNVNVSVFMPMNNTPDIVTWQGYISSQEVTNQTNPGGAVVIEGVGKVFTISATLPPPPPTTSTIYVQQSLGPAIPIINQNGLIIGWALLIVGILLAYGYYQRHKSKRATGKRGKKASKEDKLRMEIAKLKKEKAQLQRQSKRGGSKPSSRKGSRKRSTARKRRRR